MTMTCRGFEGPCEACSSTSDVRLEDSRTCYPPPVLTRYERLTLEDPFTPPDPNAPIPLCRDCAWAHHRYWDEMWAEYYASRG
jgi:hypothetical protein